VSEITQLLRASSQGDRDALDRLQPLVYDEVRAIAARHLRRERADRTLQPTELVHEVYLRLVGRHSPDWRDRAHFLGVAAQTVRRVLVEHARSRGRDKRGGGAVRVTLTDSAPSPPRELDLVALDLALERLGAEEPEDRDVVVLRYFGGLTMAEVAATLGISERTAHRRWEFARSWLYRELGGAGA